MAQAFIPVWLHAQRKEKKQPHCWLLNGIVSRVKMDFSSCITQLNAIKGSWSQSTATTPFVTQRINTPIVWCYF